ncbi:MAG: UDP-glucose/GDP-mannose dehydrogenase family protein [Luminiphilus sp.]|nr:UDP-glucose/GDP-mannose dehydrogenase family protein [Luminiphilus sp.]
MRISIFGSGYVGLVQAAVFANVGHRVICMDVDADRVERLRQGQVPFFEPGLSEMVRQGVSEGLLTFTDNTQTAVQDSDYLFICVGTPAGDDGSADLRYVMSVADGIAKHINDRKIVINKSTVPVGTVDAVAARIQAGLDRSENHHPFEVCSNPEFLKEGSAVADAKSPDRIVIGAISSDTIEEFRLMYAAFSRNHDKLVIMDPRSAELTKYAANAMLATKISFINEIANIAETVGADIEQVRRGIGSDPRIGYQFIYPGAGYGGSCFPKDVRALKHLAQSKGGHASILTAVHDTNQRQKNKLGERLIARIGANLTGKTIAVWGLAFKPNTDDMREAPSRFLLENIWSCGGQVRAFDPEAMASCKAIYGDREDIVYVNSKDEALEGADCLVVCTEWKTFWSPDFDKIKATLRQPVIIDGRNLYDPRHLASIGLEYYGIGRGLSVTKC